MFINIVLIFRILEFNKVTPQQFYIFFVICPNVKPNPCVISKTFHSIWISTLYHDDKSPTELFNLVLLDELVTSNYDWYKGKYLHKIFSEGDIDSSIIYVRSYL